MSGATVTKLSSRPRSKQRRTDIVVVGPKIATDLLEHNTHNRPLMDHHVQRIARQIRDGKWRFNGDTIKIAANGDVLDGQHRLWAIIEAGVAVETVIVYDIDRDAFATIDTVRKLRSGADLLALNGAGRYRQVTAAALTWMLRWQRGSIDTYREPQNKIENSDIEEAYAAHPGMQHAVERVMSLRSLATVSIMAFLCYVVGNRDPALAERLIATLENPGRASVKDPFYRLRLYFTADHHKRKEPVVTIALALKAINAARTGKKIEALSWRRQGRSPEPFPTLEI